MKSSSMEAAPLPSENTASAAAYARPPADPSPEISVVVPIRNEARHILQTLGQLTAQDYPPARFEVIVVDGQSNDGTWDLVSGFAAAHPNVRLFSNPRRWSSAARNLGVREARGRIVAVVDGHCELDDRRFLARLEAAFADSGADCVGRPQPLDVTGASRLQRAIAAARCSPLGHHPDSFVYADRPQFVPAHSVAVAYRKSVFERVGCFDENFDACEDVELNHRIDRAGLTCYFTPEVAVRYVPRGNLRRLYQQLVRYGRGRVRLARKHPDTLSWKTLLPAVFVAGLVAGLPLSFLATPLAWVYAGTLGLYAAIVLAGSVASAAARRELATLPWLPLVFVTIHVASGSGLLYEIFCGRRAPMAVAPSPAPTDAPPPQTSPARSPS